MGSHIINVKFSANLQKIKHNFEGIALKKCWKVELKNFFHLKGCPALYYQQSKRFIKYFRRWCAIQTCSSKLLSDL